MIQDPPLQSYESKFFIMSKEFTKNISDWRCDCTDYKNGFDFFLTLFKWPKLAVKKSQIFWCYTKERFKQFLTLKIDFENQILAFFEVYFGPFNKSHEKIQIHLCNQCDHIFNLKCFYQIPLTWWKTYKSNIIRS